MSDVSTAFCCLFCRSTDLANKVILHTSKWNPKTYIKKLDVGGKFRIPSIIDYALQTSNAEEPHCSYLASNKVPFLSTPKSLSMLGYTSENIYDHDVYLRNNGTGTTCGAFASHGYRRRSEKKPIPVEQKDEKYFERRRRNNQAAKKSRDARKVREDQVALRAAILEHENAILKAQVLTLREEASSLRQLLLQKKTLEVPIRN